MLNDNINLKQKILKKEPCLLKLELTFEEDYTYFEGHFEGFKLLPALIQIHLVSAFVKEHFGPQGSLKEIPNLKFVKPICPNQTIELEIIFNELKHKVDFHFFSNEVLYSSGTLKYV